MADGDIDYRGYSDAELGEALRAIDRERFPRNYKNLRSALLDRQRQDPVGLQQIVEADLRHPRVRCSIHFTSTRMVGVPENSFGLSGRGSLEISAGYIRLIGRNRNQMRSQKRDLQFAIADITSVERVDGRFRIRVQPPGDVPQYVTFTVDEAAAAAIAKHLPVQALSTALPDIGEVAEFERRLAAVNERTPVTYALIAINVAVFVAMAFQGAGVFESDGTVHAAWGSNLVPVTVGGEWWRLGTSMFLHFGVIHLLVNMWVLHSNGRLAERMYGSFRFAVLYLLAGLCGSMASAWWHPAVNSAGASGAVFGMLGGLLAYMLVKRYRIPAPVINAHRASLTAFVVYNVMYGLTHPGIDNAAHLGGFVAGLLIGLVLARPIDAESRAEPQVVRVSGVVIGVALLLVAAAEFVQYSKEHLRPDERSAAAQLWFTHGESGVLAGYNDMVVQAQAGKLLDADFAARIAAEVIPFYARAMEQLRYDPAIPEQEADYEQALAGYVRLRHEAMTLMESALRASDAQAVSRAMEVSIAADAAVAKVNEGAARVPAAGPP